MRKAVLSLCLLACAAAAAVRGVVVNRTSGKPAPGVAVRLMSMGAAGMQELETAITDAQGRFTFSKTAQAVHYLVEAQLDGVTYNRMVAPAETAGEVELAVYEVARKPTPRPAQRIVFLEPLADELRVNETWLFRNDADRTLYDAQSPTLRFWTPAELMGEVSVTVTAPGGMPIPRPVEADADGTHRIRFPIKPGETRFDVSYSLPPQSQFASRMLYPEAPTRLVVPAGVTLEGEGVEVVGPDPSGRAMIYEVRGRKQFAVTLAGRGLLQAAEDAGGPSLDQIPPALYDRLWWVLGPSLAALALGFLLLYRAPGRAPDAVRTSRR